MAGAVPTVTQILTWIGLDSAKKRNGANEDLLLPNGLIHLKSETSEGIMSACSSYTKRVQVQRFSVTRVQTKRIISLMYWVKDRHRTRENFEFDVGTDENSFLAEIEEATERHDSRVAQKRIGETLLSTVFSVLLKSRHQWDRWNRELDDTLSSIIGVNGVPLSYVVRTNAVPNLVGHATWENKVIAVAPITGREFNQDAKTVHTIILKNLSEDSEAYTYIETSLVSQNGRVDILALRARYANTAADDVLGNEAKEMMKHLVYKNERAMSFESFQEKFKKSINYLQKAGRPMNNIDIIDEIWKKIQHQGLNEYVAALQVQQIHNPQTYDQILQSIAVQVPKLSNFGRNRNISETNTVTGRYTREGQCPNDSVYTDDGSIFIGNYQGNTWNSPTVRSFHQEINKARGSGGHNNRQPSRTFKKNGNKMKNARRKLAKLKREVEQLKVQKSQISSTQAITDGTESTTQTGEETSRALVVSTSQAGTAFGGKNSRKRKANE